MRLIVFLRRVICMLLVVSCSTKIPRSKNRIAYRLTFTPKWNSTTHPNSYPAGGYFSNIIGMVHSDNTSLFDEGSVASNGIKEKAELNSDNPLDEELALKIKSKEASKMLHSEIFYINSKEYSFVFFVEDNLKYDRISFMLAIQPSPDWFVAAKDILLYESGEWINSKFFNLILYDAGTDRGTDFFGEKDPLDQRIPIKKFTGAPFEYLGLIKPLAEVSLERITE